MSPRIRLNSSGVYQYELRSSNVKFLMCVVGRALTFQQTSLSFTLMMIDLVMVSWCNCFCTIQSNFNVEISARSCAHIAAVEKISSMMAQRHTGKRNFGVSSTSQNRLSSSSSNTAPKYASQKAPISHRAKNRNLNCNKLAKRVTEWPHHREHHGKYRVEAPRER